MTRTVPPSPLVDAVRTRFQSEFGGEPRVFFAPGRVNLVGAHLDYNGGDVLPMAVDRGLYVAARRIEAPVLRLCSLDQELSVAVPAADVGERAREGHGWAAYPLGVWRMMGGHAPLAGGVEMVFAGDVPMASGLSSSAALEVATAFAFDRLFGLELGAEKLAAIAHDAETRYVGLSCGIMDQFASALCRPHHVLLLHCAGPSYEHVPLDGGSCEVLVMDTRKPRELADTGFNQRVAECRRALEVLQHHRHESWLAAYGPADLEAAADLEGVLLRRARHVVTEMERVAEAVAALRRGDVARLGTMLSSSHESAATDYEVSCAELDAITAAAREVEGVYGARLTGAGFGGCAIALLHPDCVQEVVAHVSRVFGGRFGVEPSFDRLRPGPGVREFS